MDVQDKNRKNHGKYRTEPADNITQFLYRHSCYDMQRAQLT